MLLGIMGSRVCWQSSVSRLKKESWSMQLGVVGMQIALSITKMEAAKEGNCAKDGNRIVYGLVSR